MHGVAGAEPMSPSALRRRKRVNAPTTNALDKWMGGVLGAPSRGADAKHDAAEPRGGTQRSGPGRAAAGLNMEWWHGEGAAEEMHIDTEGGGFGDGLGAVGEWLSPVGLSPKQRDALRRADAFADHTRCV